MQKYMIGSKALRVTFIIIGLFIFLGMTLTGLDVVHWVLYLPAIFLVFAGITGICPSLIINKMIFKED